MTLLEGIKLGLIQGLTEFLPVSSSGHLALFSSQGIDIFTEILLHFATLLAVIAVLYKEFFDIFFSPFKIPKIIKEEGFSHILKNEQIKLFILIIIATIPAAIAGFLIHGEMNELLKEKKIISLMLVITGLFLLSTKFVKSNKSKKTNEVSLSDSIIVGLSQALAIIPGLSRSGLTISTGLLKGINRKTAGIFSFLISIPVIAGATFLHLIKIDGNTSSAFIPVFHISGFITAFVSGYLALRFLIKLIKKGKLHYFAWYCFSLALISFLFIK